MNICFSSTWSFRLFKMTTHKSFYIVLDLHSGGSIQCSIVYKTSERSKFLRLCLLKYYCMSKFQSWERHLKRCLKKEKEIGILFSHSEIIYSLCEWMTSKFKQFNSLAQTKTFFVKINVMNVKNMMKITIKRIFSMLRYHHEEKITRVMNMYLVANKDHEIDLDFIELWCKKL